MRGVPRLADHSRRDLRLVRWTAQAAVDAGDGVRLVAGCLELSPPEALDESPAAVRLRSELDRLTPRIDIPKLLGEVEQWTGFTGHLTHAAGATPRMADLQQHLHAALLGVRAEPRTDTDGRMPRIQLPPARVGDRVVLRRRAAAKDADAEALLCRLPIVCEGQTERELLGRIA
jgi:hypothetical protein